MKNIYKIFASLLLVSTLFSFNSFAQCPVKVVASKTSILCGEEVSLNAFGTPGSYIFNNNFDDGTAGAGWKTTNQAVFTDPCAKALNGTKYLWFGDASTAPRIAETNTFDLTTGGNICFYMRYAKQGEASPCEGIDLPNEGVSLQYSINGGTTWVEINYYDPNGGADPFRTNWNIYCEEIPAAARTANTALRWVQNNASSNVNDHWGLENIQITVNDPSFKYTWRHTGIESQYGSTPRVMPTKDSTFLVTYTDGAIVCKDSVRITVKKPIVTVTQSKNDVCAGTPVQLNATSELINDLPLVCGVNNTGPGCDIHSKGVELPVGNGVLQNPSVPENPIISIGTRSSISSGGTYISPYVPNLFGNQDSKTKMQMIYLASELKASGLTSGQIQFLGFTIANIPASTNKNYKNFSISIGCTNNSVGFTANRADQFISGLSLVYFRPSQSIFVGRNDYTFDNTYNWDGVSNLVVEVCFYADNGTQNTYYATTLDHSTNFPSCISAGNASNINSDGKCPPAGLIDYVTTGRQRPNTIFGTCVPVPINLVYKWTPATGLSDANIKNPIASPLTTTKYTVEVYEVGKPFCAGTNNLTIRTVGPNLAISPKPVNLCVGQSAVITANATVSTPSVKVLRTFNPATPIAATDTIPGPSQDLTGSGKNYTINVAGIDPTVFSANTVVSVCVDINHKKMSELSATLKAPGPLVLNLFNNVGGTGQNMKNTCFSDDAVINIGAGVAPYGGSYRPQQAFTNFTGDPNGQWTLNLKDNADAVSDGVNPPKFYSGKLNSWSITLYDTLTNRISTYAWTPAAGLSSTSTSNPTANPTVTTMYKVKVTDIGGCFTEDSVLVSVGTTDYLPPVANNGPICEGATLNLTTTDAIGVEWEWKGPNGFTSTLKNPVINNMDASKAGDYTLQIKNTDGCKSKISTTTVVVTPKDNSNFVYSSPTYCKTSATNPKPTLPTGVSGTFSATPAGLSINASDGTINLLASNAGITYAVKFVSSGPCPSTTTKNITITTAPNASFTYANAAYCKSETNPVPVFPSGASAGLFSATPSGMVFVDNNTGVIDLSKSAPGNYIVKNTITATGCATDEKTFNVEVKALPDVTFNPDKLTLCLKDAAINLNPTVATGGTFSGKGVSGTSFDPSAAGVGSHIVKYIRVANNCTDSLKKTIVVNPLPNAAFSGPAGPYCASDAPVELKPTLKGGTFKGKGVEGDFFFPKSAGAGTHTLTYVVQNSQGCTDSTKQSVVVNESPDPSFSGLNPKYCTSDGAATLTSVEAGQFKGKGVSGNSFDPSAAGQGQHIITHVVSKNGCIDSAQKIVDVFTRPSSEFSGLNAKYCISEPTVFMAPTSPGGTFSGPGIFSNSFNPQNAGPGKHKIKYVVNNQGNCADSTIKEVTVNPLPKAKFSGLKAEYCINEAEATMVPDSIGGVFKGKGVTGNKFNPATAGQGTFEIVYTISNAEGCTDSSKFIVKVNPLPNAAFTGLAAKYCEDAPAVTLTPATTGGTFSGPGIDQNKFDPSLSGVGTFSIKYTVKNASGCENSSTQSVTVNPYPVIDAGPDLNLCFGKSGTIGTPAIAGNTYSWSPSTGLSNSKIAQPIANPTQTTKYTLTVTNAGGCFDTDEITVSVTSLPIAKYGFEIKDKTITCNASGANGITKWEWDMGDRSPILFGQNISYTYLQCQTYSVFLKVTSPCGVDSVFYEIKTCKDSTVALGVDNNIDLNKNSYLVNPNPFTDKINIEMNVLENSKMNIQLFNELGALINVVEFNNFNNRFATIGKSTLNVDVSKLNLSTGFYMLRIQDDKQILNYKLHKVQ